VVTARKWPSCYDFHGHYSQIAVQKNDKSLFKPRSHCPGVRTGTTREGIRVRSYIPGSVTDQTRFRAKIDHSLSRLSYGFRRCIPGVAPEALRCVPVRPDTLLLCSGNRRHSPGVTTASHGSKSAKPRCYAVAYDYQEIFRGTYNIYVICKIQNSSGVPRQKGTAIREGEKIGYGVRNETSPPYPFLSLIKKLFRIIQIT